MNFLVFTGVLIISGMLIADANLLLGKSIALALLAVVFWGTLYEISNKRF
jgi:hypothetical protein